MQKLLIPLLLLACLFGPENQLLAQVPHLIPVSHPAAAGTDSPESLPCNFAGTFQIPQIIGQSNDIILDTIFLCFGDSIRIDHNGDFDLSGDPNPATPPGVGFAFYSCPPTIAGDNLQTVVTDPCLIPGATNGIFVSDATANGDTWFFNNGNLQTVFGMPANSPVLLFFAPITVDRISPPGYEPAGAGSPPGPCVNVNVAESFAVVYLNAITSSAINTTDCLGRFRVRGGLPEWDDVSTYTIDIALASNPAVKALIHNQPGAMGHSSDIFFSVPEPGQYLVTIEDGKSCGHSFQVDMSLCDSSNNVVIDLPNAVSPPNSTICIPITVENFTDVVSAAFSVEWDETLLQFLNYQNPHPTLPNPFPPSNVNSTQTAEGLIGMIFFNANGDPINIAANDTLIELCFTVIGPLDSCGPLSIVSNPTGIGVEDEFGSQFAVTADNGQFCVDFLPLSVQTSVVDTLCSGMASIQVTALNGMAPYDVVIQQFLPTVGGVNNGSVATSGGIFLEPNLQSGTYSVCVTDNNGIGVTVCDTVVLNLTTLGASLDLTLTPTCNGVSDGTVSASVFLGTTIVNNPAPPDFTFQWSPATVPSPTAAVQTGVPAGSYNVTVTDNSTGCTATAGGTLGQPAILSLLDSTLTAASCSGICDGQITYSSKGGTPFPGGAYSYIWEYRATDASPIVPAGNVQDSVSVIDDLCAGTYFVTITDANGCLYIDSMELFDARVVEVLQVGPTDNPSCVGSNDGSIQVRLNANPAFTNGQFSFFWSPAGFPQMDNQDISTYSMLTADTFTVLGIEASTGCFDTATFILVNPDSLLVDSLSFQQPSCEFQNDGALTAFAVGGTGINTYTYDWSGPNGFTATDDQSIDGLAPGTYCVTATDANGCQDTTCFDLVLPDPPAITGIDSVSVRCGSDGELEVLSPTAVTFIWTNLAGDTLSNAAVADSLPGGTYIVTILDAGLCVNTDTVSLGSVTPINLININLEEPSCNGVPDGTISFGAEFGNAPYTFALDSIVPGLNIPSNQSGVFINVRGGTYLATVTDSEGCAVTDTIILGQPPAIGVEQNNIMPATCFSSCDGKVTLNAYYATTPPTPGTFTYSWSGGQSGAMQDSLCAGSHGVTITDINNCFTTTTVVIGSPPPITATLDSTQTTCAGDTNGTATIVVAGGSGSGYTYLWCNGATTATATGLPAGPCGVTVTDGSGCTEEYSVEILSPDPLTVTEEDRSNPLCFGSDDGTITVSASGGNPGTYTYLWMDQDGNQLSPVPDLTDLSSGNYSVTVTDQLGCTGVLSNLTLIDPAPLVGEYHLADTLECFGDETELIIDTIYGGSGTGPEDYTYSLDNGVPWPYTVISNIGGGTHVLTYSDGDCELIDTIEVYEPEQIVVNIQAPIEDIELGDSFQLVPIITISGPVASFVWTPAEFLINPDSLQPWAYTFQSRAYELTVMDTNGCVGTGSVVIEIDPNRNVYIPNAFRPGNDINQNDHFLPLVGRGVKNVRFMQVYDRWGSLMYEQNNFLPVPNDEFSGGWDGRYRGKIVNPGVYVYIIEVEFLDDRVLLYRGDVTVVR